MYMSKNDASSSISFSLFRFAIRGFWANNNAPCTLGAMFDAIRSASFQHGILYPVIPYQ